MLGLITLAALGADFHTKQWGKNYVPDLYHPAPARSYLSYKGCGLSRDPGIRARAAKRRRRTELAKAQKRRK